MPLDAVCLSGVVRELRETALDLRIEKVQQPARDQVILTLRGNQKLLLCAGASQARVHHCGGPGPGGERVPGRGHGRRDCRVGADKGAGEVKKQ